VFDHAGRRLGVVRLIGPDCDALIDELWRLRHPVLSVLRPGGGETQREVRLD